jgi:predicted adenylyl cyclase CyaB
MPLNLNIEIKARLADIEALTVKAKSLADQGPIEILQDDTFFACATGRLKLRMFSDGRGELIFYRRGNETGPKESSYVRAPTAVPETLRETLTLAYGQVGRVLKRRTLFMVGRTRIHIDRVSGLGDFLELEVVLDDKEPSESGVREAHQLMAQLGVAQSDLIAGAYIDLIPTSRRCTSSMQTSTSTIRPAPTSSISECGPLR